MQQCFMLRALLNWAETVSVAATSRRLGVNTTDQFVSVQARTRRFKDKRDSERQNC